MLITDDFAWDFPTFEAHVEGMRAQVAAYPSNTIPFIATLTPLSVLTLFACWKEQKIAQPLSPRNPYHGPLFTPTFPHPISSSAPSWTLSLPATLLTTSGSTSTPKQALHTLSNHIHSAQGSNLLIPLTPSSTWALTLPLFHVGGIAILFRCYLARAFVLISSSLHLATHLSLVPTQLIRLLQTQIDLPHLQTILLGGAPLPSLTTPWNVLPTYGMTEMSSQIVTNHHLHPHAEMKISPENEIWVRGKTLFQGYLQPNNSTFLPLNPEGWFETKDLGIWHNNTFQILGRKDNLFISGGENIQPEEVENAIHTHCHFPEAVVVPIPDPEFGARPVVFLNDPSQLPSIQKNLLDYLPKFKIPIHALPLPPTASLKPNRKELKNLAEKAILAP